MRSQVRPCGGHRAKLTQVVCHPTHPLHHNGPGFHPFTAAGRHSGGASYFLFLAAFAAAFISCLCARTRASDSGPVMSATER